MMMTQEMEMFREWLENEGYRINPVGLEFASNHSFEMSFDERAGFNEYMRQLRAMFA